MYNVQVKYARFSSHAPPVLYGFLCETIILDSLTRWNWVILCRAGHLKVKVMKRLSIFLVFLLSLVLPMVVSAQDVTGASIEEVAASVVLIETYDGRRAIGTGSGTIVSPDGYIYTNRHVIEDGDDFAIYMLEDISEQPRLMYFASLEFVSRNVDVDFAVLKIDRDRNGRSINPQNEALPYLPAASGEVTVGDRIRIFGYPGIGDGYMVVTSGEVVTVQNGSIGGVRLPVWFWTDAEISSGNSGGLAINENGEWIGLPTWVVSEDRTAARLGGVLPLGAVDKLLADEGYTLGESVAKPRASAGVFTLVNQSSVPICYVYISPINADNWGDDQLGAREIVDTGMQRDFEFEPGLYDVLLLDCDGNELQDSRRIEVGAETVATFSGSDLRVKSQPADRSTNDPGLPTLTIENNTGTTICYVFISPSDASTWGEDQLGETETIAAGATRSWELPPGTYDVMLQDCTGDTLEDVRGVNLREDATLTHK